MVKFYLTGSVLLAIPVFKLLLVNKTLVSMGLTQTVTVSIFMYFLDGLLPTDDQESKEATRNEVEKHLVADKEKQDEKKKLEEKKEEGIKFWSRVVYFIVLERNYISIVSFCRVYVPCLLVDGQLTEQPSLYFHSFSAEERWKLNSNVL